MVQFLAPAFLVGLAGLAIPIIIHLWNTRKSRIIKVGSIRFLQASESIKVRRISINEIPLLLLRLLIVLILVLLLSNTRVDFFKEQKSASNWILVDPLLEGLEAVNDTIQFLQAAGWEYHLLQPNYPLENEANTYLANQNFWKLLNELEIDENHPDSVLIITNAQMASFKNERPAMSFVVNWLIIPKKQVLNKPILALSFNDSLVVFMGKTERENIILNPLLLGDENIFNADSTVTLLNYPGVSIPVVKADTLFVFINGKPNSEEYKNLEAALKALNVGSMLPIIINRDSSSMVVFNLSEPLIKGTWLTVTVNIDAKAPHMLMPSLSDVSRHIITKELSINNMLQYSFVKELNYLLLNNYQSNIRVNSNLEMLEKDINPASKKQIDGPKMEILSSLNPWLWVLLLGLLSIERTVSFLRKQ